MARKALSPWAWAGIGCGSLILVGLGGCVAVGLLVKRAVDTPVDPVKNLAAIRSANVPIYPGATLNPALSRINGKAFSTISLISGGSAKVAAVSLDAPAPALDVRRWYGEKLPALGYKEEESQENAAVGSRVDQVQWSRGDERLFVQYMAQPEPGKKGSVLTLARIIGLPKRSD